MKRKYIPWHNMDGYKSYSTTRENNFHIHKYITLMYEIHYTVGWHLTWSNISRYQIEQHSG